MRHVLKLSIYIYQQLPYILHVQENDITRTNMFMEELRFRKGAKNKWINGEAKVAILLAEDLVKAPATKAPEPEAAAEEEAPAEEAPAADASEES